MRNTSFLHEENVLLKRDLDAYKKNESSLQALVETTYGYIGEEFFNKVVIKIAQWLDVDCVMIGQVIRKNIVEGFPLYLDGELIKGFTYELENTPCDMTSKKGYCVYSKDVRDHFPEAKDLKELNIQGYVGIALYNKIGETNGILCAMSRKEMQLPPQSEAILRLVGTRISAEIERIKMQKALEISETNLKKALVSKDRLFSIISHDLKTPFNALIGFSKILMDRIDSTDIDKTKKYISIIHDVSNQTYGLLTNLLDWSLTQTDDIKFQPKYFQLFDLVSEAVNSQKFFTQQKNIDLSFAVKKEQKVYVDSNMFNTILRNLISNAIKFTPAGGVINISALINNGKATISVSDTGIGMKKADIKKLFNSEGFMSSRGTDNEKGAGLGLILCKELVKKHSGDIWVESNSEKGTTFFFTVPTKKFS